MGIYIQENENIVLEKNITNANTMDYNSIGILVDSSTGTIIQYHESHNNNIGIELSQPTQTTIDNVMIFNNHEGINFLENSNYNTINNSQIFNNSN